MNKCIWCHAKIGWIAGLFTNKFCGDRCMREYQRNLQLIALAKLENRKPQAPPLIDNWRDV